MIWMFALQLLLALSAIGLLRIQRVRNYLVPAGALAGRVSLHTANVLFMYLMACLIGLAVISAGFFLGLAIRAFGFPDAGKGIITVFFLVAAIPLGIITLALTAVTNAWANSLFRTRQAVAKASPANTSQSPDWSEIFTKLREQFPDKAELLSTIETAGKGWLASLFDTTGVKAILALPHTIVFDTIEAVTGVVSKTLKFITGVLLWVAISGFVAMYLLDSTAAFWVLAIVYGLLLLLLIGAHLGEEWRNAHNLPNFWWAGYRVVRQGVRFAVAAVVCIAIYTAIDPPERLPHWMVGAANGFRIAEEETAKDWFGQNFDQRICRVVAPVHGLRRQAGKFVQGAILFPGMILWRATDRGDTTWTYRTKQYARYYAQSLDGLHEPSSQEVLVPESAVRAEQELNTRIAQVDSGVVYYPDSLGVAVGLARITPTSYDQFLVTEIQTQILGAVSHLCMVRERGKTKWVWVKERDLHFASS